MNNLFTIDTRAVKRLLYTMLAAFLFVAGLPFVTSGTAHAATQLSNRSIQMSDSAVSGGSIPSGIGSGTNVTYQVSFTPQGINNTESLIIDFCTEDPIVTDTCTRPTGMTAATGVTSVSGTAGGTGWTLTASAGQAKLANDGNSAHDIVQGTPQVFDLTGITNPSTLGSFYARIYTWTNNAWTGYTSPTSVTGFEDYGGDALSTTQAITITARVQETLTFCLSGSDPSTWNTHKCGDPAITAPALTLGHGSPTKLLDSSAIDTGTIWSSLSTNATHGAIISLHNGNSCGGLTADGGATCAIPALNSGAASASAMTAGVAGFGMFASNGTPDASATGATGSTTASAPYHNASHVTVPTDVWYGMDTTTAMGPTTGSNLPQGTAVPATYQGGVTSTFGSIVASSAAPMFLVENSYTFAATAALTTPAGLYTANLSMIATGTF